MPLLLTLFALLVLSSPSHAATPQEEYRKIQQKMEEQKKKLLETQRRESSILSEIEEADRKLGKIEADLGKLRKTLRRTEADIAAVDAEIAGTRAVLERQKDWIKRKLRTMHRFGNGGDAVILLLGSSDPAQAMRTWRYLGIIAGREHEVMEDYRRSLRLLDEKYAALKDLKAGLSVQAERVRLKESELSGQKKTKQTILASVRGEKEARRKMLAELQEASKRLLDIVRESSRKDTFTGTGSVFSRLKGKLPWPAEGTIAVPYGHQKDAQFDTPIFRNGVHIQTGGNADARSVYGGKVIFAEWFKGFGQLIIVNHGSGYHTLYGNLSEIFSNVGDIIRENQVIGKVGTSGLLNAPGLYFEVRYKGKPLDPAQWLSRRKR